MTMSYEQFKTFLLEWLRNHLQVNISFELGTTNITNMGKVDVLHFVETDTPLHSRIGSAINLNKLYKLYLLEQNDPMFFFKVTDVIIKEYNEKRENLLNGGLKDIFKSGKAGMHFMENVIPQIINTEKNKELLKTVISIPFNDLSIVFRWVIGEREKGFDTVSVSDHVLEALNINISGEEFLEVAVQNAKRMYPTKIWPMIQEIEKCPEVKEMLEFSAEIGMPTDNLFHICTNAKKIFGAAAILDADAIKDFANRIGHNLYIVPSSLHETLLISEEYIDKIGNLIDIIHFVNSEELPETEFLSNSLYYYDRNTETIYIAKER